VEPESIVRSPLVLVALLAARAAPAQVSSFKPDPIVPGEQVVLSYDTAQEGAALAREGDVLVSAHFLTPGGVRILWGFAEQDGRTRRFVCRVPDGSQSAQVYFLSMRKDLPFDVRATLTPSIRGAPEPSGIQLGMPVDEVATRLSTARKGAPADFRVYREAWMAISIHLDPERLNRRIAEDLASIDAAAAKDNPTWWYARCWGVARRGETAQAVERAQEMLKRWPTGLDTDLAVGAVSELSAPEQEGAVRPLLLRLAEVNPGAESLRHGALYGFSQDAAVPLATIDRVADAWTTDLPGHPAPLLEKARARHRRGVEPEAALQMAMDAITGAVAPVFRATSDISGKLQDLVLRDAYLLASEIAISRGDARTALTTALAAKGIQADSSPKVDTALSAARALLGLGAASTNPTQGPAPEFSGIDLDGNKVASAALRGKVVVLNFWFTGCAPCVAEVPKLNALVAKFAGRDVEFLAISTDSAERLRPYLSQRPFKYRQVPGDVDIARAFGVKAYPTHVVVAPDGTLSYFRIGGNADIVDELEGVVSRLLSARAR
jgi:thiol-disulfide isomerase/thioredoxin